MLPKKKNEIRLTHYAKILDQRPSPIANLADVMINWLERDQWFRLSGIEISTWEPMLLQWAGSAAEELFIIKIPRSPGSDADLSSRQSVVTIDKKGNLTLEEYLALQVVDESGEGSSIKLDKRTANRRFSYFIGIAHSILRKGFGAKTIECTMTIYLSDSELPVKVNFGPDNTYKQIKPEDMSISAQIPGDESDPKKIANAIVIRE